MYCDMIGRTETEFYRSTPREILLRWDAYAVMRGYKKPPEKVMEYDDGGEDEWK